MPGKRQPLVSVVMAVFDGERFVAEAVRSVLGQSWTDFEVIAINDGSSDGTAEILDAEARRDPRLRIFHNAQNLGLTKSLNLGLKQASGKYIARQDADDLSCRFRLAREVQFLETHPDHILVGTQCLLIDEGGKQTGILHQTCPHEDILAQFVLGNAFAHGSVMFRNLGRFLYDETIEYAQDYELWTRMALQGNVANLADFLYQLRIHNTRLSTCRRIEQEAMRSQIAASWRERMIAEGRHDVLVNAFFRGVNEGKRDLKQAARDAMAYGLSLARPKRATRRRCARLLSRIDPRRPLRVAAWRLWVHYTGVGPTSLLLTRMLWIRGCIRLRESFLQLARRLLSCW